MHGKRTELLAALRRSDRPRSRASRRTLGVSNGAAGRGDDPPPSMTGIGRAKHQRYVRSELWKKSQAALGSNDESVPDCLNEDNLARYGAYWS